MSRQKNYRQERNWASRIFLLVFLIIGCSLFSNSEFKIDKIIFAGNSTFAKKILAGQINQQTRSKFLFWKKREIFDRNILEQDIEILRSFYQTQGFLKAEISAETSINDRKKKIDIEFIIKENEPILIGNIDYNIIIGTQQTCNDIQIPDDRLKAGNRFRDNDLFYARKQIKNFLLNNGYPFPKIEYKLDVLTTKKIVNISFEIDCGGFYKFAETKISGNEKTDSSYIERENACTRDTVFDQRKLELTQQRIMNLGMFRFVTVKEEMNEPESGRIPLEILVREADRFRLKFGVGYGTEEQFRLSVNIRKLGFFRSIDRFDIYLKYSRVEPYHIDLKLTQPLIFSRKNSLISNIFVKKEKTSVYSLKRYGAETKIQRRLSKNALGFSGYSYQKNFLKTDPDLVIEENLPGNTEYNKSNILCGINFDNSAPVFFPYNGMSLSAVTTLAGIGFNSDFHYYQILLEGKKYFAIGENTVIAGKIKAGFMQPILGDEVTPLEERFYAGGSNSVRGWAFAELGPESESGKPVGGNSLWENSLELRFPVWKIISGVIFTDFGNVWSDSFHYDPADFRYAYGSGIRLKTPVGPLRLDGAFSEDGNFQFFFSIGQAF